jgi:hypothetical protein
MRPTLQHISAWAVAVLVSLSVASCTGIDTPMPPNGPDPQSFSTNNALIRIVNGSPTAGSACVVGGQATTCIDVFVDGKLVAPGVPYPTVAALSPFAILPYVSVPAGPVLIQLFQSGTHTPVFENAPSPAPPLIVSAGKKYSFVLGGNAPVPPDPFFAGYLFNDGLFNPLFGISMADFHNASINAGAQQFEVFCNACTTGGQQIGNPAAAGTIVGPVNLVPSGSYTLGTTTKQIAASTLNGLNTGSVLPDPFGKPNVSIYLVDTVGGAGNFQVIGIEDSNG